MFESNKKTGIIAANLGGCSPRYLTFIKKYVIIYMVEEFNFLKTQNKKEDRFPCPTPGFLESKLLKECGKGVNRHFFQGRRLTALGVLYFNLDTGLTTLHSL